MRALPMRYRNVLFRSRLEADWAANLDHRELPWTYEPEGYELDDGTCYSPDFWLPTARAWLEVKGEHNLGLDKTERFAQELWNASPAFDTYHPQAPMVLIGREPQDDLGHRTARLLGTMGPGKRYSVAICTCPGGHRTVVAVWQPTCRSCGTDLNFNPEGGAGPGSVQWSAYDNWIEEWRQLPRPAGRR